MNFIIKRNGISVFILLICLSFSPIILLGQMVSFDDSDGVMMVVDGGSYKIGLLKSNGAIKYIIDKSTSDTLTTGSRDEAMWQVLFKYKDHWGHPAKNYGRQSTFNYSWDDNLSKLTMNYIPPVQADTSLSVRVSLTASSASYFDLQMKLTNNSDEILKTVWFPNHLKMFLDASSEALVPLSYPGTILEGGFFSKHESMLDYYPGLFLADYLGFKLKEGNMAIYTLRDGLPIRFTYTGITPFYNEDWHRLEFGHFFYVHQYPIYTEKDSVWNSPVTRFYIGKSYVETLKSYRIDNKIDKFPSLQEKLGDKYEKLLKSPWFYKIFEHNWSTFNQFAEKAPVYPHPSLLLITGSNIGGFDFGQWPDVKPDPNLGTEEEFINMIKAYQDNDVSTMLFTLLTELNPYSQSYQDILSKASLEDVVGVNEKGELKTSIYGQGGQSYTVTPQSPFIQEEFDRIFKSIFETYGCEMIYEDGVGVAGDPYDFNKYLSSPLDNKQGWLEHTRRYHNYLQIVEGGNDRMAETCVGFIGSTYGQPWFDTEDVYGNGVWSHFPALTILFHDKVIPFHFWGVKTHSKRALSWNLAYGCILHSVVDESFEGDNLRDKPWMVVVGDFQKSVQSRLTGKEMTSFSNLTDDVIQSVYEDMTVIFNRDTVQSYETGLHSISPNGNLVTSSSGDLIAGIFTKFNNQQFTDGDHFLIVENYSDSIFVRQPMGNDTPLKVDMLSDWEASDSIWAVAFDSDDKLLDSFRPSLANGTFTFTYRETVHGQHVAYYKIYRSLDRPESDLDYVFNDFWRERVILGNSNYEIAFTRPTCDLLYLFDRINGDTLYFGGSVPIWTAEFPHAPEFNNFVTSDNVDNDRNMDDYSYSWSPEAKILTWKYESSSDTTRNVKVILTIDISNADYFDMQIAMENHWNYPVEHVSFPGDLMFNFDNQDYAVLPVSYPGIKLMSNFFDEDRSYDIIYPGTLTADYAFFRVDNTNLAVYSIYDSSPVQPIEYAFHHPWYSNTNCTFMRRYLVNIADSSSWTSPVVRFRLGQTLQETIANFRNDNQIDSYPNLDTKLKDKYVDINQSPLFYTRIGDVVQEYKHTASKLSALPNPSIIMLDNYYEGGEGYNGHHPDYYPPKSDWGTTEEFKMMVRAIKGQGKFVMPYTIPSWWNENSPTVLNLSGSPGIEDMSVISFEGEAMYNWMGGSRGYVVSPFHPFVKSKLANIFVDLKGNLGFDLIYEELLNNMDIPLDFNQSAPSHKSYREGWRQHTELYKDSLLIVDKGYDRLAEYVIGFIGNQYTAPDEESDWDNIFGAGNWFPYPVTPRIYHDKIMQFPHWEKYVNNKDALSWNLLYGCNLNFYINNWAGDSGLDSPWINVVSDFQKHVVSKINGKQMTDYATLSPGVSQSTFEDVNVIRNWSKSNGYTAGEHSISPQGALAMSGELQAGILTNFNGEQLDGGDHYLIVKTDSNKITIRHPMGSDTPLKIRRPSAWKDSSDIHIFGIWDTGNREISGTTSNNYIIFDLNKEVEGNPISYYEIKYSGITNVSETDQSNVPLHFRMFQNYPNPFNPTTTIKFAVKSRVLVVLKVYNILGRTVKTLVDKKYPPGFHQVVLDASDLASGLYFYEIKMGEFREVKKALFLK